MAVLRDPTLLDHLGIVEQVEHEVGRRHLARNAGGVERGEPARGGSGEERGLERVERGVGGDTADADRRRERGALCFVDRGDAQPTVGGLVQAVARVPPELHGVERRTRAVAAAVGCTPRDRRVEQLRIHDRRVDELALPGAVPVVQGLHDGDRRQEAVAGVAERHDRPERDAVVVQPAVEPVGAGERGTGLVVARQSFAFAVFEPAGVAVDDVGFDRLDALVVDAETDRRVVAHVVLYDVGRLDQLAQDRHRVGVLQVHRDAALPAVAAHRDVRAHPVAVVERIDLDHVGTEVGQHHRSPRAGDREAEVEHAHARER